MSAESEAIAYLKPIASQQVLDACATVVEAGTHTWMKDYEGAYGLCTIRETDGVPQRTAAVIVYPPSHTLCPDSGMADFELDDRFEEEVVWKMPTGDGY